MNSDYPLEFKQLWHLRHECVKWSQVKMNRLDIRNEPVRLKNIRLGTQDLCNCKYACYYNIGRHYRCNLFADPYVLLSL